MANKEKLKLMRGEDFDQVDQELAEAMSLVDAANERVVQLLSDEREVPAGAEEEALFGEPEAPEAAPPAEAQAKAPGAQKEAR